MPYAAAWTDFSSYKLLGPWRAEICEGDIREPAVSEIDEHEAGSERSIG